MKIKSGSLEQFALKNGTFGIFFVAIWASIIGGILGLALGSMVYGLFQGYTQQSRLNDELLLFSGIIGALILSVSTGAWTLFRLLKLRRLSLKLNDIAPASAMNQKVTR